MHTNVRLYLLPNVLLIMALYNLTALLQSNDFVSLEDNAECDDKLHWT